METKTKTSTETMSAPGAYTPFHCVTSKDKEIFNKLILPLGIKLVPIACATQVVHGTNYKFFCNSRGVYPGAIDEPAMVTAYEAIGKDPIVTDIYIIKH